MNVQLPATTFVDARPHLIPPMLSMTMESSSSTHRPHVCPVPTCSKRFTTSGNLSRHKRLHGYIEPLQCPIEGCVCTFPSNKKLEKHMKFHFGSAVKVCRVFGCGKTFSTTGNLNRHMKHHHNDSDDSDACSSTSSTPSSRSPSSIDQWPPSTMMDCLDDHDAVWTASTIMPTTSPLEFAGDDDLWTPELIDTLVSILNDTGSECVKDEC